MPACPPVDCFLWVLQQHRTGYKSHCIITAPRFASRSTRPERAWDWPARLLGRPLRAGHRCNRKSRLLPWGRWLGRGLSLNCQSCSFLCAPHSVQLSATRWVRSDETRCIPTETYGSRLIKAEVATCDWSGRTDSVLLSAKKTTTTYLCQVIGQSQFYLFSHAFSKIISLYFKALRVQLSRSGIFVFFSPLIFFWLRDSSTREKTNKPLRLSLRHQKEKSSGQDWCFRPVTCRSVGLLLLTFIHWVIFLIQIPRNGTVKEEYRGIWLHINKQKINQNSIMGCPLLRNAFAGLILILLSKGKFLRAT